MERQSYVLSPLWFVFNIFEGLLWNAKDSAILDSRNNSAGYNRATYPTISRDSFINQIISPAVAECRPSAKTSGFLFACFAPTK